MTTGCREIRLNAFDMACVGHIQHGMWTHPRDRSSDYASLDHWVGLARLLERGLFDGLFLADVLGVYDVYRGNADAALAGAVQIPLLDPMALVPAMAHATTHLGFGVTANLVYEPPFLFARRMATLDHLTRGRIGWNIVTGYLDSAARAMGYGGQIEHDDRYELAEEYLEVVYALWEGGWADDAVRRDRRRRLYTDPHRVRRVRHRGQRFAVDALPLWEPSPQRTPVLYQAGASDRGRRFAARHAECIFVNGSTRANVGRIVADLRRRAAPRPLLVFVGASIVVGRSSKEAGELLAEYRRHASVEGALAHAAASLGIGFGRYGTDEPIAAGESQAIRSNVEAITAALGPGWSKRQLVDRFVLGSRQPAAADRRDTRRGRRRARRLGAGSRCRRLQPLAHGRSLVPRKLHRTGGTSAARARRLQARLCPRHLPAEIVRLRRPAAGRPPGGGAALDRGRSPRTLRRPGGRSAPRPGGRPENRG